MASTPPSTIPHRIAERPTTEHAGALIGGFTGGALWGITGVNDWSIGSLALAIGGAILLLAPYRIFIGRRRGTVVGSERGRWAA